jgi:hypothetical protein
MGQLVTATQWEVTAHMKKHYEYFDADGEVKEGLYTLNAVDP